MKLNLRKIRKDALIIWGCVAGVVLLGVLFAFLARIKSEREAQETLEKARQAEDVGVEVVVTRVKATQVSDVVRLPGVLEPWSDVMIAAEKAGRIVEMPAELGDRVEVGDVLLRVDDDIWAAIARRAEVEAVQARNEWRRYEGLARTGAVSESELDAVRKARDLSEAALDEAQSHLDDCTVRSPVNGVVESRFLEPGEFPAEGQAVLRVVDTRRLKLIVEVPEKDVTALRVGARIGFTLAALGNRGFSGVVRFVSDAAMEGSNAFRTEIEVDNADGAIKAGMIASVRLEHDPVEAISVPLSAVVPDKGEHVVYVVEDGRAVRSRVRLRDILDERAVIEEGLNEGETLVLEGQRKLQDGQGVVISNGG